jgi:protein-S-isoprenylcysteine O-methyltransferase Ste14
MNNKPNFPDAPDPGTRFGARGEGWVIAQFILIPIVCLVAYLFPIATIAPIWDDPLRRAVRVLGAVVAVIGIGLVFVGARGLGPNLTPNPKPRDAGVLVQTGVYAIIRHPIYAGIILLVLAFGLYQGSLGGLMAAMLTFVFFDQKSRREERWLRAKFPNYADYARHTRKLIPFVY